MELGTQYYPHGTPDVSHAVSNRENHDSSIAASNRRANRLLQIKRYSSTNFLRQMHMAVILVILVARGTDPA